MLGVSINALAIIGCTLLGILLRKIINDDIENIVMIVLGVCVLIIGITDAINPVAGSTGLLVMVVSCVIGSAIGAILKINTLLEKSGAALEKLVLKNGSEKSGKFAEGFVQATMVFCIGAMAIYGSISAGLGDNKTLLVKAVLDGTLSMLLGVKYGWGVMFSAIPVFIIQGVIALSASALQTVLVDEVLFKQELSAIGGVIVTCIGLNLLGIKKIPIADMVPAIFGACYYLIF